MLIIFAHSGPLGPARVRVETAAAWLTERGHETVVIRPRDTVERGTLKRCRVFVMQMASGRDAEAQVLRLRARGVKCVYDLDDNLWDSWLGEYDPEVRARIVGIITACDAVTVTTDEIKARLVAELGPAAEASVYVVPNDGGALWETALL